MYRPAGPVMVASERVEVPRPRGLTTTVVVVGDQLLTAQAVSAALGARGYRTHAVELLHELEDPRRLRRSWGAGTVLGLVLHELVDRKHTARVLRLLRALPGLPWLVLTGSRPTPTWGEVLAAGARGAMPTTVDLDRLVHALELLATGSPLHSAEEQAGLVAEWERWSAGQALSLARLELLSPREAEVLEALRRGATVTEVARAHAVSIDTVRSQVRSILKKLEVPSQLAAVAILQQAIDSQASAHRP